MKTIFLKNGLSVQVSDIDYPVLMQHKWWSHFSDHTGNTYAYTQIKRRTVYMHRLIAGVDGKGRTIIVDHKDRHTLNNQRPNLRVTNGRFNNVNRKIENSTGLRGVRKVGDKYQARVDSKSLGYFDTLEEAGIAHDLQAIQTWGEFAWLNFPDLLPLSIRMKEVNIIEDDIPL